MTTLWVVVAALSASASAQLLNNGFINPLFLPRTSQTRGGRMYDPWASDRRDGFYLSGGGGLRAEDIYRDRGLLYDPRYDERRYQSRYDDLRRYRNRYQDDFLRYPSRYEDFRRYPTRYDDYRRLSVDGDRRYNEGYRQFADDARYLQTVGLSTTVRPDDRLQVLDRGQGLDGGQILSTSTPDLSVTVQPNGSA